jgi:hypothetical protein
VPLDYYFQPHQEWLAESIVTEYILCNYQHTPLIIPWYTPAGLVRQLVSNNHK